MSKCQQNGSQSKNSVCAFFGNWRCNDYNQKILVAKMIKKMASYQGLSQKSFPSDTGWPDISMPSSYTVKKVNHFPVPSRDVTDQTLSGREKLNYSRPGRFWSVTSRLGTGKRLTLFYSVHCIENPTYVFPEMKLWGLVPNSYIYVSMSQVYFRWSTKLM
jgi:hypothetical protein